MSRTTLEEFIAPISQRLGHDGVPDAPVYEAMPVKAPVRITDGLSQAELVDLFVQKAKGVKVGVTRTNKEGVAAAVGLIVSNPPELDDTIMKQDGPCVYEATAALEEYGIPAVLGEKAVKWDASLGRDALMQACNNACFGITTTLGGIAETGTIIQPATKECGRAVNLLPLCHIAIVRAQDIVPTLGDAMKQFEESGGKTGEDLPSSLNFISGVSATSDIELVRVEGVHGPMFVYYIIVE